MTGFLALVVLGAPPAHAGASEDFAAANNAFAQGDLAGAEAAYRSLLAEGYTDGDVFYNLGNALWREERPADALLAWRCAAARLPRDPDVSANLEFARRTARDALELPSTTPVFAPWQAALTPAEGCWFGAGLIGVGLLLVALRRRAPEAPLLPIAAVSGLIGGCVWGGGVAHDRAAPVAVVLADEVTASSDLGGGVDLFALHAGAEVVALEEAAGKVLLGLPDGRKGWVPAAAVGIVDPDRPFPASSGSR
jgi:hypothetical protein